MKRYNNIFWMLLCAILIVLNGYTLYQKNIDNQNLKHEITTILENNLKVMTDMLENVRLQEINILNSEGRHINSDLILSIISDDPDIIEEYTLGSMLFDRPKLIFDVSVINCIKCEERSLEYETGLIKDLTKEIGEENILFLGHYRNRYDAETFQRLNKLDFPIYNKRGGAIGLPVEQMNVPYMFLINSKTQHVFVPDSEFPELTKAYFSLIKKQFQNF